jgi:hypothetical protein
MEETNYSESLHTNITSDMLSVSARVSTFTACAGKNLDFYSLTVHTSTSTKRKSLDLAQTRPVLIVFLQHKHISFFLTASPCRNGSSLGPSPGNRSHFQCK